MHLQLRSSFFICMNCMGKYHIIRLQACVWEVKGRWLFYVVQNVEVADNQYYTQCFNYKYFLIVNLYF
jgi:hypothetical protein